MSDEETKNLGQPVGEGQETKSEPKAITQEDLEKMKTEMKAEAFKQYQGIQRVVSQKDDEIKRLKESLAKNTDFSTLIEVAERQAVANGDSETLAKIAALKVAETEKKRVLAIEAQLAQQQQLTEQKRVDLESRIRTAGQDPEDVKFDNVWLAWELAAKADGDFSRAEKRLDKLLAGAKPAEKPGEKKVETEAEIEERIRRKILEESGSLDKEKLGSPSKGSLPIFTEEQIKDKAFFNAHKLEIIKAQEEGRIKYS